MTRSLGALKGTWERLEFIAGLRAENGKYEHWGLESVHGKKASLQAIAQAHTNVFQTVLETPISALTAEFSAIDGKADASCFIPKDLNGCTKEHFRYVMTALTLLADARSSHQAA